MSFYPVYDYGYVLDEKTLAFLQESFESEKENVQAEDDDVFSYFGVMSYSVFSGGINPLKANGDVDPVGYMEWDGKIVYLPTLNSPQLTKPAYPTMDCAVEDMKAKYAKYLPEDFNFKAIVNIVGTYYG
jgi:hypothetical protein